MAAVSFSYFTQGSYGLRSLCSWAAEQFTSEPSDAFHAHWGLGQ